MTRGDKGFDTRWQGVYVVLSGNYSAFSSPDQNRAFEFARHLFRGNKAVELDQDITVRYQEQWNEDGWAFSRSKEVLRIDPAGIQYPDMEGVG